MAKGKYEAALMNFIPSNPQEWSPTHIGLLTAVNEIDYLTSQIISDSQSMARKFTNFADEMKSRGDGWSPMGYSTLRDLEVNIAKLEVHKTYFRTLIRAAFSPDAFKEFFEVLNTQLEAA